MSYIRRMRVIQIHADLLSNFDNEHGCESSKAW